MKNKTPKKKSFLKINSIKIGQSYSVNDISDEFDVCKKTILNWHKKGLPAIDNHRPMMFFGEDLKEFLSRQRNSKKFTCQENEFLCLSCKKKVKSSYKDLILVKQGKSNFNVLIGKCESCGKKTRKIISYLLSTEILKKSENPKSDDFSHYNSSSFPTLFSTNAQM